LPHLGEVPRDFAENPTTARKDEMALAT
jgi:hypothetical protein